MRPELPHRFPTRPRPLRAKALVLLLALTATGCAGEVARYRDAAVGPDGVTIRPAATPSGGADQSAASTPDTAPGVTVPDTTLSVGATAGTGGSAGTTAVTASPAGGPPVTLVSGPAARLSRQASAGGPAPAARGGTTAPSGPTGATNPTGPSAAGSGPVAGGGGGNGPAVPAPAPGPSGGTTTGLTRDTMTLGFFYPKTGAYTGLFRNLPAVVQAAADEAGPINGRRLVVKYYDDGTANASTIQVEEKRAKDESFSLASIVSEANVVLGPLADRHKVPIVIGNIDQKVGEQLTYGFAIAAYWARQATILPSFIKNVLGGGGKKIGIVYEGTSTAIDAKNAFKDKARELSLNVVFEQPIAQNQSTCANEVSNLQAHGVELVYMMNGPLGAICMLRDAKALGYKPTWTGVGGSWSFNVVAAASGGGADGIRTISTTITLETPQGRHYADLIRKAAPSSGADTDDVMLAVYSMMRSTLEGLRRAGPDLTRESLVQTWETKMNGYDSGYLPPPTFGPGIRSGPLVVGVTACCTNGQWTSPQQGWRATF